MPPALAAIIADNPPKPVRHDDTERIAKVYFEDVAEKRMVINAARAKGWSLSYYLRRLALNDINTEGKEQKG